MLRKKGIHATCYHGKLSGEEAKAALYSFKVETTQVIVATVSNLTKGELDLNIVRFHFIESFWHGYR